MKRIIEINNLRKYYIKNKSKILVLNDITYNFELGKLYVIMGNSGAGKTTFIELLGLLLDDYEGTIKIDGKNVTKLNENEKAHIRNKTIGFVFQSFYLNPFMTAYENVMLPMYINNKLTIKDMKLHAYKKLKELGLENREKHFPKELSGGEQQRVAIARALINNPSVILADEPTGSLDSVNEKIILKELKKLTQNGKCVIIVSHSKEVKKYADIVLKIENKKIIKE